MIRFRVPSPSMLAAATSSSELMRRQPQRCLRRRIDRTLQKKQIFSADLADQGFRLWFDFCRQILNGNDHYVGEILSRQWGGPQNACSLAVIDFCERCTR
ncbi:hypothetical protein [Mesorhizobium shangrilense]|uniref:Uncharacterized protein n=1 Tax=Mesorhizobium shangrilense TaxID=460060 RepID=A0ABV2DLW3_9HYPH